jgi:acetate---CoA ligase (ADP-forming) subunit beta
VAAMLKSETAETIGNSKGIGWVLEPEAKRILSLEGLPVPRFLWAKSDGEAMAAARDLRYPVVAKVVSPQIIHKSDVGGVALGITNDGDLKAAFLRFSRMKGFDGVIIEEMLQPGLELIVGATMDYQFGPVILLGIGGTAVEIYGDTALRLAPLAEKDVQSMVNELKAHSLLEGYRGSEPVNMPELARILVRFSQLVMDMEDAIESVDLNPVVCAGDRCTIADARIMLAKSKD